MQTNRHLNQGCTNPNHQVVRMNKFCAVPPNVCGSSLWDLYHVTILASRILRWLLHFPKICAPLILVL